MKILINYIKYHRFLTNIVLFGAQFFLPIHQYNVLKWKLSSGDQILNVNYPLNTNSIIFDVGGYGGNWTDIMYSRYLCEVYIFEPVIEYVQHIRTRFKNNRKIHIFPYGLANVNKTITLHMEGDRTSEFGHSNKIVKVKLVDIKKVLSKFEIKKIDLISINIEGGEYDLLDYMIETNLIKQFKNIQIQFHLSVKNAVPRMKKIQKALKKTHILTYQFPFVWENWNMK